MHQFVEYTLSDVLKDSGKVLAELERGRDVLIRRRSKPSLILIDAQREQLLRDSLRTAAAVILAALGDNLDASDGLVERVADRVHWLAALPANERGEFLREFARTAASVVETGALEPLIQLVGGWEITSRVHSSSHLSEELTKPVRAVVQAR